MLSLALENSGYQTQPFMEVSGAVLSCKKLLSDVFLEFFAAQDKSVQDVANINSTALLDIQDVKNSLGGDSDAYKRLVERHQKQISSMMWRFSRDRVVHEELVQDVFVQVYMSLHTFKRKSPFTHWLCRVATRVGFRYWKNKARKSNISTVSLEDWDQIGNAAAGNTKPDEAGETLHRLLKKLPPRDRLVLTVRYLDQQSIEQTAEVVGWSVSMVKVQTWRAKNKLKKLFEEFTAEAEK